MDIRTELHNLKTTVLNEINISDNAKEKIANRIFEIEKKVAVRSVDVKIVDSDIATIEALHDLLLDAHGYSLDFITLKRARELTNKMYNAFK